jgi:DNA-3-methyladenine glycosylase I
MSTIVGGASPPSGDAGEAERPRCAWARSHLAIPYHDNEWGVPVHDERTHYEFLVLEAAQAGLSWETVLRRREGYRDAFAQFDAARVAAFDDARVSALVVDDRIIRNRAKITAAIDNARALTRLWDAGLSLDAILWEAVGGVTRQPHRTTVAEIPAETPESRALSRELKRRGFAFVGPVTIYAHMQATGLVNDHVVDCFRHGELGG